MAFVNVDGERIYYEDSGGSLPAVVLLHGFLLDRACRDSATVRSGRD
jgi:pimeloyl-ACP methyl ester carboxylesterase